MNLISVFGLTSLMDSYVSLTRPFVSQRTISTRHRWKTAGRSTCHRFMSSSSSSRKERKRQEEQETKLFVRPSPLQIRNKNGRSICLPSSTRRGKWFFKDENKKKKKKRERCTVRQAAENRLAPTCRPRGRHQISPAKRSRFSVDLQLNLMAFRFKAIERLQTLESQCESY